MTRITNADHVLLLLQEQLVRLGRDRAARAAPKAKAGAPAPMDRLRALSGQEGISDDDLKRALVRGLLVQQLGEAIGNDPAFETIAGDVLRIITASGAGRDLLEQAALQLGLSGAPKIFS